MRRTPARPPLTRADIWSAAIAYGSLLLAGLMTLAAYGR